MLKNNDKFDIVVLGSGPSGCACAIRCAQLGLKTLCIDNLTSSQSDKLNYGIYNQPSCFESIILLESAKIYDIASNKLNSHGIYIDNITLNLGQLLEQNQQKLISINQNVREQFKDNHIDFVHAIGKLIRPNLVEVSFYSKPDSISIIADHIVLATESRPVSVPCAPIDNVYIFDSIFNCQLNDIPKRLAILGAGVHGLELGVIWNKLGVETILLDAQESFLDLVDHQISREAYKIFSKQGLELQLGTRIISTKIINKKVVVEYQDIEGIQTIKVDNLFVAPGRKPNSEGIASPESNLLLDENGYVFVNDNYKTNLPNVYAIGDLTLLGPMLPHKGIAEGRFIAAHIAGIQDIPINYDLIPSVIYTDPGIAWVGSTEQTLKAKGIPIKIGCYQLRNNILFLSNTKNEGLIKVITCAETDTILGIHILSTNACDLINEAALALEFTASNDDINNTMHPYPNYGSIRDATMIISSE